MVGPAQNRRGSTGPIQGPSPVDHDSGIIKGTVPLDKDLPLQTTTMAESRCQFTGHGQVASGAEP